MNTPLPQGLLNVVSIRDDRVPDLQPADKLFARQQIIYGFWKVYHVQSRTGSDTSDKRCEQLFWRVLSCPPLRDGLSEASLQRLWQAKQESFDLAPFTLIENCETSSKQPHQRSPDGRRQLNLVEQSLSVSADSENTLVSRGSAKERQAWGQDDQSDRSYPSKSSQTSSRPGMQRHPSSGSRKRSQVVAAVGRGKARPVLQRKGSSRVGQQGDGRSTRQKLKSPMSSAENDLSRHLQTGQASNEEKSKDSSQVSSVALEPIRRISTFDLGSASSWQSMDERQDSGPFPEGRMNSTTGSLQFSKDFRNEFREALRQQSLVNLPEASAAMRKTGSVVRFADDVDKPADLKGKSERRERILSQAEDGPPPLPHRDSNASTGSQAIDSDEDGRSQTAPASPILQRSRSQISMALEEERRESEKQGSVSAGSVLSQRGPHHKSARMSNPVMLNKTEEERKVLAMAHKEGVTKAGGVQVPKHHRLSGRAFELQDDDESPDEATF